MFAFIYRSIYFYKIEHSIVTMESFFSFFFNNCDWLEIFLLANEITERVE